MPFFNLDKNKKVSTITKISYKLWDITSNHLPYEKPKNTVGRPTTIAFRELVDVFYMFLGPIANRKYFQKNLVLVLLAIGDFNNELN